MRKEIIGDCVLYNANCLEILPDIKADLLLTDPPYGINADVAQNKAAQSRINAKKGSKAGRGWREYKATEWDSSRPNPEAFAAMLEATKEQVIWGGNYFADLLQPSMRWLGWDKGQRDFSLADMELAWTSQQKAMRVFTYARGKALRDGRQHPTQKPVELMEWCIGFFPKSKTILDPYMGSGSTIVACAKLGRKGIGIELDPDYFEIACKRVEEAYRQPDLFVAPPVAPTQDGFDL